MLRLSAILLALALAPTAVAEDKEGDKPKPNTLTPMEIAEGWVLLFDGESTFGWTIDGAAEVKDSVLVLGKGKKTVAYPTVAFGNYFTAALEVNGRPRVYWSGDLHVTPPGDDRWGELTVTHAVDTHGSEAGSGRVDSADPRPMGSKRAPFCIETDGKNEVKVRSIKLKPLGAKPLFNGKNLDGWKVNDADKRMASKWTVTPAGELSVKNGPGDLVSDKQFDNFVLQFECKTNGKGLNSGVFFRCVPGQYQNGYEAQIQNSYKDNDRTKPADFGTGAIYRRVPARKVVSNDNQWFTMTVVADGRRIATWVNGYQTVAWTDDRKEDENPRKGFRAAKGPISIQGHDPTTDILFRNIRIAELPSK